MPPKSASEVAVAASPVPVPGAELEASDEDEDEVADDDVAELDGELDDGALDELLDELSEPGLLEPQPATTRASAARAATAPVRGAERGIRELRTKTS
jgi:hypothetical protein